MPPSDNMRGEAEQVDGRIVDRQGVHLDEETIKNALLKGAAKAAGASVDESGEPDGPDIIGDTELVEGQVMDKQGFHLDMGAVASSVASSVGMAPVKKSSTKGKTANNSADLDLGLFQPIWEELQQIPFSEDNYRNEIAAITKAVKQAGNELKIQKIVANTKALAKNAQKFYQSDSGMRVVFSILGNKFSMSAKGSFTGGEAFYLQVNGDTVDGVVLRKDENGDFSDVTESYKVLVEKDK